MPHRLVLTILITLLLTACAPAAFEPMQTAGAVDKPPTREVTATFSSPILDTQTVTPKPSETATTKPTEGQPTTESFAGLGVCKAWRESEKCPITENDFKKISEFVKADFKFPPEALSLYKGAFYAGGSYGETFFLWPEMSGTIWENRIKMNAQGHIDVARLIIGTPYSPIGQPYFFNLPADGSRVKEPIIVAVYPVKNSDGSIGTYSIIAPPYFVDSKDGSIWVDKERTEEMRITEFDEMIYCPPIMTIDKGPTSFLGKGGTFVAEVVADLNNPNGVRKQLIKEFVATGTIPEKMEEIPLLGSWGNRGEPKFFK
jgi:hypothetical protein